MSSTRMIPLKPSKSVSDGDLEGGAGGETDQFVGGGGGGESSRRGGAEGFGEMDDDDDDDRRGMKGMDGIGGRMFRKLDIRVNSFGARLALFLRNPRILMLVLGVMLVVIILVAVSGQDNPVLTKPKPIGTTVKKFTNLENALLYPSETSYDWVKGDADGTYVYREPNGNIMLAHVATKETRVLALASDIKDAAGNPISYIQFTVSSDLKFLMLETKHTKAWRHSYFSEIYLYDIAGKTAFPLTKSPSKKNEDEVGAGMIGLSVWSPTGHNVAWVRDNDIYVTVDTTSEIQLTVDGSADIINGVSDWVYEEEVLASKTAMWFSADGSHLAYLKFNESAVPDFHLQRYFGGGASGGVYPQEVIVKYPKAGKPNPTVTLHIATPSSSTKAARDAEVVFTNKEDVFPDEDRLIVEVKWVTKISLLMRMMNRVQDAQRVFLVEKTKGANGTWIATKVRDEKYDDEAWFTFLQPITVIPPSAAVGRKDSSYIEIQDNADGFSHIAYYSSVSDAKPSVWLTSGHWEVTNVYAADPDKGVVYFASTEEGSTQRHLYSVHLDGSTKTKLTPPKKPPTWSGSVRTWNTTHRKAKVDEKSTGVEVQLSQEDEGIGSVVGEVGFYDASFSPKLSYYLLSYKGPDVPFQQVVGVEDDYSAVVTRNEGVSKELRSYGMPRESFFTVPVDKGVEVNVKLLVPYDFDVTKKYPMLVKVYGGPNSQTVRQVFELGFETGLIPEGYIVLFVDPRGTGARGRKFRTIVSKKLGHYETLDTIEAVKQVVAKGFVDKNRVAIWGWSYGGYLTSKVIEADSGVFAAGMAVAPVTDWKLYDSIYTERYMKTPQLNPSGYEESAVKNMDGFKNAAFLLAHGTYDDNVHFQNSAQLVWQFTQHHVRTYRSQFFPDSDHSISAGGAFQELQALLREFLAEHCRDVGGKAPLTGGAGSGKGKAKREDEEEAMEASSARDVGVEDEDDMFEGGQRRAASAQDEPDVAHKRRLSRRTTSSWEWEVFGGEVGVQGLAAALGRAA
ncbi:dipeptidyl peptidase IV N-terminal region-domain-containing protein [Zopfochytrium polystomum]|nr:dipeptidyl peptidase IV N-terminal region-domain-containing protein [Zopfochytrium polystomum]